MREEDFERLEEYRGEGLEGSIKKWKLLKEILCQANASDLVVWRAVALTSCGLCKTDEPGCKKCVLYEHTGVSCTEWEPFDRIIQLSCEVLDGYKDFASVIEIMLDLCNEIIETLEFLRE